MVPIATDTTANITQLQIAISDIIPAHDALVPLIDNLTPEASQAPLIANMERKICMT